MAKNDPVIAFKLLVKFIREKAELAQEEHDRVPWIDMPEFKETKIYLTAHKEIYNKALYLADKFNLDGYDLINNEYPRD